MERTKPQSREDLAETSSDTRALEPAAKAIHTSAEQTATPHEHAVALAKVEPYNEVVKVGPKGSNPTPGVRSLYSWDHAAAAVLHGWTLHEYHAGAAIQITRAAYESALAAASAPDASGRYVAHPAARSPYAP
jgi:hypothetical protein